QRVGIRSRRTTLPLDYIRTTRNRDPRAAQEATLYTHAEAGRRAAAMALARAGITVADVGMVVAGSSVMDTATPAEACNIARALGIEAPALDVNSACTSFFAQLHQAHAHDGRRFHFVGHQANLRMLEAVCRQCSVPGDRHHANVEWYGNTAGAGAPSVLSMRWDDWTADDDVAVVGVGAGLTWASYLLRFEGST